MLEHQVAGGVPIGVVDPLEEVEIAEHQREVTVAPRGAGGLLAQPLLKAAVVVEAGQAIAQGQALQGGVLLTQQVVGREQFSLPPRSQPSLPNLVNSSCSDQIPAKLLQIILHHSPRRLCNALRIFV